MKKTANSFKKIAIIAHDGKKAQMVSFIMHHLNFFGREDLLLYATGTTGKHVEEAGVRVKKLLSGPLGGDAQIAQMVSLGELDLVIFFRDPLGMHPHEPDVQMLMRLCDVHEVPLATNPSTAKLLIQNII